MPASPLAFTHDVTERFLRYVVIDTQSDPASPTCPSTEKQKNLGRLLASELQAIGLTDAHLDEHGYVYATIPANTDKKVPVICFCSHMDTSPDCTGANVKPQIVRNYQGGDIVLPADPTQVIRAADHPALADQIGHDIITTDGTTLLGADNKAGLAEIMDAARFLVQNPAYQARHHQDPVHARRGDRPRRRQGRPEEARRRLRLYDGRRNRREYRGRNLFGRRRHHHHRGRLDPSRFRQGQDGARDQDRGRHRRPPAQGHLLAGDDRGQGRLFAPDRHYGRAGESHHRLHRARFHRRGAAGKGSPARRHRQRGDEGLSALDLPDGGQARNTAT